MRGLCERGQHSVQQLSGCVDDCRLPGCIRLVFRRDEEVLFASPDPVPRQLNALAYQPIVD